MGLEAEESNSTESMGSFIAEDDENEAMTLEVRLSRSNTPIKKGSDNNHLFTSHCADLSN